MSFDPRPMSTEDRKYQQLAHAQRMLNIINSLGNYSAQPLPKFDYSAGTKQLNLDINSDFLDSILNSGSDRMSPRKAALKRRQLRFR